jgi:hypothetical protein
MSNRRSWATQIGLCLLLWPSCAGDPTHAVKTLTLPRPNAVLNGELGFTWLAGVRELADGRVLAVDPGVSGLFLVDFTNDSVTEIGRKGKGPEEYSQPGRLYPLSGDSTLLTDLVSRRWLILDGARIVRTLSADRPANRLLGPILAGVDTVGSVLGVEGFHFAHSPVPGDQALADSLRAVLVHGALSRDNPSIDTLGKLAGRGRFGVDIIHDPPWHTIALNPLSIPEQVMLFPDGWVAFAFSEPYRVDWRRPDGTLLRGRPLPFRAVKVTAKEFCAFIRRENSRADCDRIKVPDVPEVLPPFMRNALLAAPNGDVLVRRTPSARAKFEQYDIVDRTGGLKSVLRINSNQRIVGFGRSVVYVITVDDMDLQRLSRHRWTIE